jgi:cytidine deaminase
MEPAFQEDKIACCISKSFRQMKNKEFGFFYEAYDSIEELAEQDASLLTEARKFTRLAYAPYSHFRVGAAARLVNGEIVCGSNEENASFPAGLCAERVVLASLSSSHPGLAPMAMAISYKNDKGESNRPIFPCGICRQSFQEYEHRYKQPIRLVLSGMEGIVFVIPQAGYLLPLAFTSEELR